MKNINTLPLSYIALSQKNLEHNLKTLRALGKKGTKFVLAVKGNAYGHGQNEIVRMAEKYADYFMVNSIEELRLLRQVSRKPTFVLGYVAPAFLGEAIRLGCILGVFSLEQFHAIERAAEKMKIVQEVHIACDALLGREGFLEKDLAMVFRAAKKSTRVQVSGMYAHFANIEDTNNLTHAERQLSVYARMKQIAEAEGFGDTMTHIAATSGLLAYESISHMNPLVRIGIGMYGIWPSDHLQYRHGKKIILKPVLSWKTHVAQVKRLPAGSTIGYGLTYMTKKPTTVALLPQGYADGFPRTLSNAGSVLIGGKKCRVLGRVSMNMTVVDASLCKGLGEGDEVVIIGSQGSKTITAEAFAEIAGTINYEALTRISSLLPRIVQ